MAAALLQQLTFRGWVHHHPASYISIALYPVVEPNTANDLEDPDEV